MADCRNKWRFCNFCSIIYARSIFCIWFTNNYKWYIYSNWSWNIFTSYFRRWLIRNIHYRYNVKL